MRVKIKFPAHSPLASMHIPVRIGDINYGNHVGNDAILSILHEARMQFIAGAGHTEIRLGNHGLIMGDVMIAYRGEAFYGDQLLVELYVDELTARSFDFLYRVSTTRAGKQVVIAEAKTGMICYDYSAKRIVEMGPELERLIGANKN